MTASDTAKVEHHGAVDGIRVRPTGSVAAGAEVEDFAGQGFTVLSF
jgi:hypothetical protein